MDKVAMKCPICGKVNSPALLSADVGSRTTIKMEYICSGEIRRFFRPKKRCETRYKVELYGAAAERAISAIYLQGKGGKPRETD